MSRNSLNALSGSHRRFCLQLTRLRRRAVAMWGAPPRPRRARYGRYGVHESLSFLFQGRVSAPSHPLDGRETAIPPAERARSALRCRRGMQFPRRTRTPRPKTRARRAARRRCADPLALRRQESKLHSEAAGASEASGQAEVCGPACLTEPGQRFRQPRDRTGAV